MTSSCQHFKLLYLSHVTHVVDNLLLLLFLGIPCPHHQTLSPCHSSSSRQEGGEKTPLLPSTMKSNGNGDGSSNGSGAAVALTSSSNGHAAAHDDVVSMKQSHYNTTTKSNCLGLVPKIPNAKVYATEIAIAIHSIIIGFTMGINPNTSSLIGFTIAMIFHQLFEGVALSMIARQGNLDVRALVVMVFLFSLSLPTGILIGLIVYRVLDDDDDNDDSSTTSEEDGGELRVSTILFQGVPNAISAGMLLHIGFELMMEDFNHKSSSTFPTQKLLLAFLGGAMFCFIAIWA